MDENLRKEIKTAFENRDLKKIEEIRDTLRKKVQESCNSAPLASSQISGKRLRMDELADALLPDSIQNDSGGLKATAFCSSDNGNCLYNSCSIALIGNESLCHILRILASIEMLLNSDYYVRYPLFLNADPFECIENKFLVTLCHDASDIFSPDKQNYKECIQKEGILNLNNKRWSSLMCLLALSSAIGMQIRSIYPTTDIHNTNRYEDMFNLVAIPSTYTNQNAVINIPWSRSGSLDNTKNVSFKPNHFVPVLHYKRPPTVKGKQTKITGLFLKGKIQQDTDKLNKCELQEKSMEVSPTKDVNIKKTSVAEDSQSAADNYSEPPLQSRKRLSTVSGKIDGEVVGKKTKEGKSESVVTQRGMNARGDPVIDQCFADKNDIGLVVRSVRQLDQEAKLVLLTNIWKPTYNFSFPVSAEGSNRKRKFSPKWLEIYPWLAYSQYVDGAFCKYCVLFGGYQRQSGKLSQLVSMPLTLWTSATSKFQSHQKSQFHANAVQDANVVKRMSEQKSVSISQTLSGISQGRIARNREIIKSILRGVIYLARQNIAYRGHRDESKHIKLGRPGNFQAMLDLLAENGNDVLRRHFETSPLNASYRSKTIQNEMIDVRGKFISEALVNRVRKSKFFSVLADEVQDKSNQEQLAVNIRYVDENNEISEFFLTFVHCHDGVTGRAVADLITKAIEDAGLNMDHCRGQGYDGAGNMAGKYSGAAKLIQNVHKSALYVHCFSHQLNLCVAATCKVMSIDKVMNSVRIVSDFFNNSPKRQQLLEKILIEKYGKESKLLNVCRTRWVQRLDGLDRFEETIECVVKALEVMDRNEDRTWNSETHTTAGHLLSVIKSFEFIANLIIIQRVLSYTRYITVKLQKIEMDIMKGYSEVNVIRTTVKEIREDVDKHHKEWYDRIKELAKSLDTDERSPRICPRQTQRENHPSETTEDYYKVTVTIPVIDHLLHELNTRFSLENINAVQGFCIIPAIMKNMISVNEDAWRDQLKAFLQQYQSDLPLPTCLSSEIDVWKNYWINCHAQKMPDRILTTLKAVDPDMFPNIFVALKILAVLPVTTCSCERTISALGRIKTDLRTTMTQERLNALALLHIHNNIDLNLETILNRFAMMHPRRMLLADVLSDQEMK